MAENKIGTLTYTITLKLGDGEFTDNGDGTFNFTPASINSGKVVFNFAVVDSYGEKADRDIELIYKSVNPIIQGNLEINKSDTKDMVLNVNLFGEETNEFAVEFLSLSGNDIIENDFIFDNEKSTLTIKHEFIEKLNFGKYTFTLTTTAGKTEFVLSVVESPEVKLADGQNPIINDGEFVFNVDLKGAEFVNIKFCNEVLSDKNYTLSDGTLTLTDEFTSTLADGMSLFELVTTYGSTNFEVIINDQPIMDEKNDFVKLPGETIQNESFKYLVHNEYGKLTYTYELVDGDGELTDNGDGTFSFVPASVYAGDVVIKFTAKDEFGKNASRNITLTYKTVNPIIYDADGQKKVDLKDNFDDIVMTVDTFGHESNLIYFEMKDILLNGESIGAENFVLKTNGEDKYFSVKSDYLKTLKPQVYTFLLVTEAGQSEFVIEVLDTREPELDKDSFEFIKNVTKEDITINITPYNNVISVESFTLDGVDFTHNNFTYEENTLVIFNKFLNSLPKNIYKLKINGTEKVTINVKCATAPVVEENSKVKNVIKSRVDYFKCEITCQLFGLQDETLLLSDGTEFDSKFYEINEEGNYIKIDSNYLKTLEYGSHEITVQNSNGKDLFTLCVGDYPIKSDDNFNVTKFTHEKIEHEKFRVKAVEPWSLKDITFDYVTYVNYLENITEESLEGVISKDKKTISGDFGRITINDDFTFNVERANGWFGVINFKYVAEDELGFKSYPLPMEIKYLQNAPAIDGADAKIYDKTNGNNESADIVYTITNASGQSDFTIYKLMNGDTELIPDTDYIVGDKADGKLYFTLKASYLATLDENEAKIMVYTNGGRQEITIKIVESLTCEDPEVLVDKYDLQSVGFSIKGNPSEIKKITYNGEDIDTANYTFVDNVLLLKADALEKLKYGENEILVNNGYKNLVLKVKVYDSREPKLSTSSIEYAKGTANTKIEVELFDKTFDDLLVDSESVAKENYSFQNGVLTMDGEYLDAFSENEITFTLKTSVNELVFLVTITEDAKLPDVTLQSKGYEIDKFNNVEFNVNLNENTFKGVQYMDNDLALDNDYNFENENNTLKIKANFLNKIYRFGKSKYSFTLITEENNNIAFNVVFENSENRVLNAGFETGNLYGWNSYGIWKNEPGMLAWTDDRVVNGNYFDKFAYNKDGEYNLGIYGGNINKDSGQERMGHLRSSDFVLGGSGYISFKLGGGKNSSFAYVSVRKTLDNSEVARFANRHFGKETETGNGEAYMFQYYFDLSTVGEIGESYYFVISDTTSNEWCVLSADSFYTYYETAPETIEDTLAENIVPEIINIETADNSIKNGNFDADLNDWSNVNGVFKIEDGFAISNEGGDGATGVLRSSAFNVKGNKYVRFDWAGALRQDKQVFISVKEIGTNIEALRFARRDSLHDKQNGDFDNHMLDLTSLDENKLYYLEFADNYNGNWGLSKIDNIELANEKNNEFKTAVKITGIETEFTYKLPY